MADELLAAADKVQCLHNTAGVFDVLPDAHFPYLSLEPEGG